MARVMGHRAGPGAVVLWLLAIVIVVGLAFLVWSYVDPNASLVIPNLPANRSGGTSANLVTSARAFTH